MKECMRCYENAPCDELCVNPDVDLLEIRVRENRMHGFGWREGNTSRPLFIFIF